MLGAFEPVAKPWGMLGIRDDFAFDQLPEDLDHFEPILEMGINRMPILGEAGMGLRDIVRINAYVTDRAHMAGYMQSRDAHVGSPPPASTLMIVSGFTRPEFKVEIEVVAAAD